MALGELPTSYKYLYKNKKQNNLGVIHILRHTHGGALLIDISNRIEHQNEPKPPPGGGGSVWDRF